MQLFIDNWRTTLLADAAAADTSLSVLPAKADQLVGLGAGDYYELTLVRVVEGVETAWEVVRVSNTSEGLLAVTRGPYPLDWLEGELISARLTAGALRTIQGDSRCWRASRGPNRAGHVHKRLHAVWRMDCHLQKRRVLGLGALGALLKSAGITAKPAECGLFYAWRIYAARSLKHAHQPGCHPA